VEFPVGGQAVDLTVADLNGDGKDDIAVVLANANLSLLYAP
jgi:hypothetical protein